MRYLLPFIFPVLQLYAGSLSETDIDLAALFDKRNTSATEPSDTSARKNEGLVELALNYQGPAGNFLVFYDYRGARMYLQFRRDKWDYDNDFWLEHLMPGQTYIVKMGAMERHTPETITGHLLNALTPAKKFYTSAEMKKKTEGSYPDPLTARKLQDRKAEKQIRKPAYIYSGKFSGCYPAAIDLLRK